MIFSPFFIISKCSVQFSSLFRYLKMNNNEHKHENTHINVTFKTFIILRIWIELCVNGAFCFCIIIYITFISRLFRLDPSSLQAKHCRQWIFSKAVNKQQNWVSFFSLFENLTMPRLCFLLSLNWSYSCSSRPGVPVISRSTYLNPKSRPC